MIFAKHFVCLTIFILLLIHITNTNFKLKSGFVT